MVYGQTRPLADAENQQVKYKRGSLGDVTWQTGNWAYAGARNGAVRKPNLLGLAWSTRNSSIGAHAQRSGRMPLLADARPISSRPAIKEECVSGKAAMLGLHTNRPE